MAHDDDIENETNVESSEETPLLRDPELSQDADEETDQETDQKHEQKRASWYLWRIFWVILAALILTIFIKGWIDAGGDVDVRSINPQWLSLTNFRSAVRPEESTQASPGRRSERCSGYGTTSSTFDGT